MSNVYEEAYHHFVWTTKMREPMIVARMESLLYTHIHQKCAEMKTFVHALGGMPDHVHLVCSLPTTMTISEFVKNIKGSSAHYINHHTLGEPLAWQPGYGHLTFAKHDLARINTYVDNQKSHHARKSLSPKMERVSSAPDFPVPQGLSPGSPAF